jgi:glycosyltransferase involved in cell wall biosynthesis
MRIAAIIEALTVTGPAKNLLRFGRSTGAVAALPIPIERSIITFRRGAGGTGRGELPDRFVEAVQESGIDLDLITERFRFDPWVVPQLAEVLKRRSPDIVQTHGVKSHFLMRFSGLRRSYRWIAFHHGYTAEDRKMRLYNQLDRWSLAAADRVVTVCRSFADVLAGTGVRRERIAVLPNAVEEAPAPAPEEALDLRRRMGIRQGERVILTVGRFSREKAQADLVRASACLRRTHPGLAFRVVLLGDGPLRREVERAAEAAGLSGAFLFAGHQRDVRFYFGMADLFVLPSHSEGSPNALLEAMASGVPVVATSVGGVPETVEGGENGLLVPRADPQALAEAIGRLLVDDALARRLANAARATVERRHSPAVYERTLVDIYRDVLQQ